MAKFYQPRETQGIYEVVPNRLTVNQYDRVTIGFKAVSPKELQDTTVDASDVVATRYAIDPTTIELNIDTTTPRTFTLTATQEVMMSATPKDMTKPLEVVVRRPTYSHKPAVGQQRDPAACWAACLSYWLSVAPGRDDRSFVNILGDLTASGTQRVSSGWISYRARSPRNTRAIGWLPKQSYPTVLPNL